MARPLAMGDKVSPGAWSSYTAETINNLFERLYKAVADLSSTSDSSAAGALANGLDTLVPSANDLIVGQAGGTFGLLSFDSSVQRVLVNDGGAPGWGQVDLSSGVTGAIDLAAQTTGLLDLTTRVTGILPIPNGGTGLSAVSQGDLLYGSAANVLSRLGKNTTASRYLANSGTSNNPAWDLVDLSNGVKNRLSALTSLPQFATDKRVWGFTGTAPGDAAELSLSELLDFIGSAAQGDVLYRDASAWARLPAGSAGQVLRTGGAGANPSWQNAAAVGALLHVDIPISQTDYRALGSTPILLIAAPGAGLAIVPVMYGFFAETGTAFTGVTIFPSWNTTHIDSGIAGPSTASSTFFRWKSEISLLSVAISVAENQAVNLTASGSPGGSGTFATRGMTFSVYYIIVPTQ